ncbi:uncharacterized protein TNCV_4421211 [Trichonephila clavipes]|nr:uncharacterized protein TNCV_4421211 [Trichonephila clavipes]
MNPIAFVADIKMAFLMIEIDESERDFTRIFWDENPGIDLENKRLDIFRMTRVLFGIKSNPFLLAATIKHHLKKYVDIFPDTLNYLNQSLYVDDFLCGNVGVQAALTTCIESKQILEDASMDLRKWRTNSSELNQRLKNLNFEVDEHRVIEHVDSFKGLDWDDKLPKQLEVSWNKWCNEIHYLSEIKIPQYYFQNFLPSNATTIQLHCFSDAFKKAYGTVAYLRIELNDGNIISSFVASKGRVAPLKTLSIPRLELMGALLSARLSDKIATALILPVSRFYWTDSSITCYWIKGDFNRHKVFVKNRIKEIQKLSDPKEWRYCKGKDNPADLISRGLPLNDLKNNKIWWHGPKWLTMKQTEWPLFSEPIIETEINNDKLELKKSINVNTAVEKRQIENNLISRYSSFSKLIRISALCLRFIYNCKVNPVLRKIDCISASEFDHVTKVLVKQVQLNEFLTEIKCLKNGQPIPKSSKISSLNVFLDEDEILRVGGRLEHSTLSEFQKHQMMLPKAHHLTDLIIEHYHKKSLHSGLQTTLYLIRQFYWIPSGQKRVRRILNKCITCFRTKTQTINQMMGDLPRDRIVPSRPFEKVGLDYAGPIITKPNLKRSRVTLKSYIAIFICFSTKATHLEVVSILTTEAFLACLRRFIARRSKPSVIWSDNATNFKGVRNILNEWNEICKSNRIQLFSAEEGIEWNFIPPASPHFGGLWEANIKSMKRILLRIAKSAIMNFEELTTLMAQIEAVLNSRLLSPLSSDPNDLNPLTPGHFLTNCAISSFPEPYTASDSLSYHSRWKLIQSLRDKFWNRWSTEYLTHLQTRAKWSVQNPNLMENQLLKDPNTKPLDWPMGRILEVFPGSDGLVRVVNVKTSTGILKRAITKVVPLPIPVDPASVEKNI